MSNEESLTRPEYCHRGITGLQARIACAGPICTASRIAVLGRRPHDACRVLALQQFSSAGRPCGYQGCAPCRSHLASLLKEHCLVEGGDSNVKQWLKDVGVNGSVASALKVGCWRTQLLACCDSNGLSWMEAHALMA